MLFTIDTLVNNYNIVIESSAFLVYYEEQYERWLNDYHANNTSNVNCTVLFRKISIANNPFICVYVPIQ